jgi:hypothetical protein
VWKPSKQLKFVGTGQIRRSKAQKIVDLIEIEVDG